MYPIYMAELILIIFIIVAYHYLIIGLYSSLTEVFEVLLRWFQATSTGDFSNVTEEDKQILIDNIKPAPWYKAMKIIFIYGFAIPL